MAADKGIVVSCRDVWKIFGRDPIRVVKVLRSEGLSKDEVLSRFGAVIAVGGVTFDVYRGEILCIMGLSGSGKSTLIRHINRLIEPTAGQILIGSQDIGQMAPRDLRQLRAARISMVFQHSGLFPHLTLRDNVAFGLEVQNIPFAKRMAIAKEKLELVQLGQWLGRYPSELSGGMQQRVGLARALATDPELILMDEPFSALDPLIRRQMQSEFLNLWRTLNKTAIFITHDLDEAIRIGDRIAIMKEGEFVQIGTPESIVTQPKDNYVKEFVRGISKLKFVRAHSLMCNVETFRSFNGHAEDDLNAFLQVREDMILDELIALKIAASNFDPFVVVDSKGNPVGIITVRDLLNGVRSA